MAVASAPVLGERWSCRQAGRSTTSGRLLTSSDPRLHPSPHPSSSSLSSTEGPGLWTTSRPSEMRQPGHVTASAPYSLVCSPASLSPLSPPRFLSRGPFSRTHGCVVTGASTLITLLLQYSSSMVYSCISSLCQHQVQATATHTPHDVITSATACHPGPGEHNAPH